MTEYFSYFSQVHISKLLHVIQTNQAIVSESMALHLTLICEREGACSVTEVAKNYLGHFKDGADGRQLLFRLC